ncbi:radical SAM protein [Anaerococcus sp. Marseille-P9784]|uniref:radical SAM protein n=1 Tax=Anaerococcus sp. Marseille-P9784 TaxID=2614127 RepID=UPI00124AC624|nr:radical SAM protein [Anaerococcus sp. Marseille-P9784]
MHYTGQVYRPPLEAYTPLLEVTYGCSHNKCIFCAMYNKTKYGISPLEDIESDIIELKNSKRRKVKPYQRIYLLNGDPFVLPTERLLEISKLIKKHIPECKTITAYCSFYNLENKSIEDLKKLKEAGYNELWFGVETGFDKIIDCINKGTDLDGYYRGLDKMKEAGIEYHAIVMQGIAGAGNAEVNAKETAKVLNYYPPKGVYIMSTSVMENTPLYYMRERGEFMESTNRENIEEQIYLLKNLKLPDTSLYSSGHVVNLVNMTHHMDKKDQMIKELEEALEEIDPELLDMTNQEIAR